MGPKACTTYDSLPGPSRESHNGSVSLPCMLSRQKMWDLLTWPEMRWWKKLRQTSTAGQGWRNRMAARALCPQTSWTVGFQNNSIISYDNQCLRWWQPQKCAIHVYSQSSFTSHYKSGGCPSHPSNCEQVSTAYTSKGPQWGHPSPPRPQAS